MNRYEMPADTRRRLRRRLQDIRREVSGLAFELVGALFADLKDRTPRRRAKRVETKWRPPSDARRRRIDREFLS